MEAARATVDFLFHHFIYACAIAGAGWFAYWLYAFSSLGDPLHDTGVRVIVGVAFAGGALGAAIRRR